MTGPKVSIIMPAFNAAHCVTRAIGSVQAQTEQDLEIIVVDDASSDATVDVVRRLAEQDPRIILLAQKTNRGPSAARNMGIDQARGKWLALLDADDAFKPERVEMLCALAEDNALDAIGDDIVLFDDVAAMEVGAGQFVPAPGLNEISLDDFLRTATYRVGLREALYRDDKPISLLKLVLRADFVKEHCLQYSDRYRYCEDFLFYYELLRLGARVALLDRPMYVYTEPLGSISRRSSPHSRTIADRQSVIDVVDEILSRDWSLSAGQQRLLDKRKRSTDAAMRYTSFRQQTSHCSKPALYGRVALRPTLWLRFVRELRHGFTSRIRHNRLYREGAVLDVRS